MIEQEVEVKNQVENRVPIDLRLSVRGALVGSQTTEVFSAKESDFLAAQSGLTTNPAKIIETFANLVPDITLPAFHLPEVGANAQTELPELQTLHASVLAIIEQLQYEVSRFRLSREVALHLSLLLFVLLLSACSASVSVPESPRPLSPDAPQELIAVATNQAATVEAATVEATGGDDQVPPETVAVDQAQTAAGEPEVVTEGESVQESEQALQTPITEIPEGGQFTISLSKEAAWHTSPNTDSATVETVPNSSVLAMDGAFIEINPDGTSTIWFYDRDQNKWMPGEPGITASEPIESLPLVDRDGRPIQSEGIGGPEVEESQQAAAERLATSLEMGAIVETSGATNDYSGFDFYVSDSYINYLAEKEFLPLADEQIWQIRKSKEIHLAGVIQSLLLSAFNKRTGESMTVETIDPQRKFSIMTLSPEAELIQTEISLEQLFSLKIIFGKPNIESQFFFQQAGSDLGSYTLVDGNLYLLILPTELPPIPTDVTQQLRAIVDQTNILSKLQITVDGVVRNPTFEEFERAFYVEAHTRSVLNAVLAAIGVLAVDPSLQAGKFSWVTPDKQLTFPRSVDKDELRKKLSSFGIPSGEESLAMPIEEIFQQLFDGSPQEIVPGHN